MMLQPQDLSGHSKAVNRSSSVETFQVKVKVLPLQTTKSLRALDLGTEDGGGWSAPLLGRFTPGKDPVPFLQEAG